LLTIREEGGATIMRKKIVSLVLAIIMLAFEYSVFYARSANNNPYVAHVPPPSLVDIAVTTCTDINAWLMSQPYHNGGEGLVPPPVPVPWMKLDTSSGKTCPVAPIIATVQRFDNNGAAPNVSVRVDWVGRTVKGAVWTFDSVPNVGLAPLGSASVTGFVSNVAPPPGDWTLEVDVTVTSGEGNVNLAPNFVDGTFRMLGFCDLNGNFVVDVTDFQMIKKSVGAIQGSALWRWTADVTCDGAVSVQDYQKVKICIPKIYVPA
jgi:hypothetical protein